ncbi:F-box/LRR-repeat protein At2g43260, partial [Arabidopsis lyrata subsp. lyrata]|uniref:F-box/LRR-repeat protein At2g43260 n=1 Tax=Arabidopsis lyrata subsp. lyrata TaxID=81972 RepID=UPI000A29E4F0
ICSLAVSKKENLFFHDNEMRLFKYFPETNGVHRIVANIHVLSPFVENMVHHRHSDSAPKITIYPSRHHHPPGFQYADSWISKFCRRIELPTTILISTTVVALVIFRFSSRLR